MFDVWLGCCLLPVARFTELMVVKPWEKGAEKDYVRQQHFLILSRVQLSVPAKQSDLYFDVLELLHKQVKSVYSLVHLFAYS